MTVDDGLAHLASGSVLDGLKVRKARPAQTSVLLEASCRKSRRILPGARSLLQKTPLWLNSGSLNLNPTSSCARTGSKKSSSAEVVDVEVR